MQVPERLTPAVESLATEPEVRVDGAYIGLAVAGTATSDAKWQIFKANSSGVSYADNVTTYSKVWDNRASYTYTN